MPLVLEAGDGRFDGNGADGWGFLFNARESFLKCVGRSAASSPPSVWEVATRTLQYDYAGHTGAVLAVTFSADGVIVASGSDDGTVKLWNYVGTRWWAVLLS